MIETGEILQTMQMIQEQNFDIRTITLGINLLDCSHPVTEACAARVYDKICQTAKDLVKTGEAIERELGIPIVNKRISVTPNSLICQGDPRPIARALDKAAKEMGVNFLGGYSALMQKGATKADERLVESIPEVLATAWAVLSWWCSATLWRTIPSWLVLSAVWVNLNVQSTWVSLAPVLLRLHWRALRVSPLMSWLKPSSALRSRSHALASSLPGRRLSD